MEKPPRAEVKKSTAEMESGADSAPEVNEVSSEISSDQFELDLPDPAEHPHDPLQTESLKDTPAEQLSSIYQTPPSTHIQIHNPG